MVTRHPTVNTQHSKFIGRHTSCLADFVISLEIQLLLKSCNMDSCWVLDNGCWFVEWSTRPINFFLHCSLYTSHSVVHSNNDSNSPRLVSFGCLNVFSGTGYTLHTTSIPGPSRRDGDEDPGKIHFLVPKFWEKIACAVRHNRILLVTTCAGA